VYNKLDPAHDRSAGEMEEKRLGYDLDITRSEQWAENGGCEITHEEWLTLVANDPGLSLDPVNGERYALWSGRCRYPDPWFKWWQGNISTKYPGRAILGKMLEIATTLGANVQGDEGELYTRVDDLPQDEARAAIRRPWWRLW
jgi:hypothetical protein